MGRIPDNYIQVPENSATAIPMDIDVMVRKTIIYLYSVEKKGKDLNPYDDYYYYKLPSDKGIKINKDEPGAANIFYPVYYNTCAVINTIISSFIALIKPIIVALQLPDLLLNAAKLAKAIAKIIDLVMKLIDEIIKMISDTKKWFIEKFLGIFKNIKLPKIIGDLFDTLMKNIDIVITAILSIILAVKDGAINMVKKLISALSNQLSKIGEELSNVSLFLSEHIKKRNDVITYFFPDFNEVRKETLSQNWLDAIKGVNNFSIDAVSFINEKWDLMKTDKNKVLEDAKKELTDEEKTLSKIDQKTEPKDYKEQEDEVNKLKKFISDWEKDITYNNDTSFTNNTKLYRLVEERQKIVDYYLSKKSFLEKLKISITEKLAKAKKKLKELMASISLGIKKLAASLNAKIAVVNAYINAIIEAIVFPFRVIATVIKNLIAAITGFLANIPNLKKMLEGVIKLVNSLKELLDPTKVIEAITKICIEVFDSIKKGLGKVLDWMLKNGGILLKHLKKAIEWCEKHIPEILEFVVKYLGLIIKIIGLVPMMVKTILEAYINYAFSTVPSPVKSAIGI